MAVVRKKVPTNTPEQIRGFLMNQAASLESFQEVKKMIRELRL